MPTIEPTTCHHACPGMDGPHHRQQGHCTGDPTKIPTAVFVDTDGTVYRFSRFSTDVMTGRRHEKYEILTLEGYQSVRYELPATAELVWWPPFQKQREAAARP